ncbi:hypothetical protein HDU98_010364 [Podochytrium sp. JEL0797]|nr:hypothetical protein HDU98_010364 [Podochytrium sp. JEL0797]
MDMELRAHPDDSVSWGRKEGKDNGKSLDWFVWSRNVSYFEHPVLTDVWCPRYAFIGKTDDDTVIHVPRLSRFLLELEAHDAYIGREVHNFMLGFLYLFSTNLVEWIVESPIPRANAVGHEDKLVREWFAAGNLTHTRVHTDLIHNSEAARGDARNRPHIRKVDDQSIAVHYCKSREEFFGCMQELYE